MQCDPNRTTERVQTSYINGVMYGLLLVLIRCCKILSKLANLVSNTFISSNIKVELKGLKHDVLR